MLATCLLYIVCIDVFLDGVKEFLYVHLHLGYFEYFLTIYWVFEHTKTKYLLSLIAIIVIVV